MRAWIGLVLTAVLWPASPAQAQDLTGRYVFQSPAGPVVLVLEQAANRVTGRLEGADGNVLALQGQIDEAGRAVGTITVNGGTGWFAAGIVNGQLLMAVAEFDANGQPDMENGWSLTFERVGGAGGQGGAMPAMPGAAPANQGKAPGVTEDSPLLRQWRAHLSGKRVTYMDSYSSSSAGSYGGYSFRWDAYICSDGTLFFKSSSMVNADAGAFGFTADRRGTPGRWKLVEQMGQVIIQYQLADGTSEYAVLSFQDGKTYVDGKRVYVTNENPHCRCGGQADRAALRYGAGRRRPSSSVARRSTARAR